MSAVLIGSVLIGFAFGLAVMIIANFYKHILKITRR